MLVRMNRWLLCGGLLLWSWWPMRWGWRGKWRLTWIDGVRHASILPTSPQNIETETSPFSHGLALPEPVSTRGIAVTHLPA